jgi:8-oxo-dGTP pyrophosphatase MutT (NUDIX family)
MMSDKIQNFFNNIPVDPDRRINIPPDKYSKFQNLLSTVKESPSDIEHFPRAVDKNTPIPSFGLIPTFATEQYVSYYMCQRRTTIEFGEMLRCGPRKEFLFEYLSAMTEHERQLLCDISDDPTKFHQIWRDYLLDEYKLFAHVEKKTRRVFDDYAGILRQLVEIASPNYNSINKDSPWGFPKGREKTTDATRLKAALRETEEETKLRFDEIRLIQDDPINILTRGTDGCLYSTTYFVIRSPVEYQTPLIQSPNNILHSQYLSHEMQNYQWLRFDRTRSIKPGSTPLPKKLEQILIQIHDSLKIIPIEF